MSAQNFNSITFGINFQTYSSSYFFQISAIYTCLITGVMPILIFALRDKVTNRLEYIFLNSGCDRMHVEYESKYFESIFRKLFLQFSCSQRLFNYLAFQFISLDEIYSRKQTRRSKQNSLIRLSIHMPERDWPQF